MKKLLSMMVVGAFVMTASFVSADPRDAIRDPANGLRGMWRCQQEDKAKQDKAFKAIEDEAAKLVDTTFEKRRQPPPSL